MWGEPIGKDYQTVPQQIRYAGYWYDGEVQWYWLAGRQYDPEIQRFLQPDPTDLDGAHTYVYANDDPADLIEVGGAFSISGFFHHAVEFLDSAAHVTFKVAEAAWDAVAGDDIHTICCTSDPVPLKALAALDLALTVVPGADVTKLLEVGVKGAAKAGGEQAAFALVRWIAGKTDSKVAADLSDNALRDAFRARKEGGSSALRDAERVACEACFAAGTLVATAQGEQAIQTLHVGDSVQAEDPTTGKVEAAAVQAVIGAPSSEQLTLIAPKDILTPMVNSDGDRGRSAQVIGLYTAARAGAPMQPRAWVEVVPSVGIGGDRYATRLGHWSDPRWPDQEVTLVEGEVAEDLAVDAGQLRRNIVTRGVRLNDLIGRTFQLGGAQFVGVRRCDPCRYLDSLTRPGLGHALRGRGGLRAHILQGGRIHVADRMMMAPSSDRV